MSIPPDRLWLEPGGGCLLRSARYCAGMVNAKRQETLPARKRRGPIPTGKGHQVGVRLQPELLARLDGWIAKKGLPAMSRANAIRSIVDEVLNER